MSSKSHPWHLVQQSTLHGTGVFAARDIPAGTKIFQYAGRRITVEQADALPPSNPDEPFHTFFFSLSSGKIIDGAQRGNDSRWINHACQPNCEGQENANGTRVYIVALKDIKAGDELLYDYCLQIDEPLTQELRDNYRCLCGSSNCRGTMLEIPEEKPTTGGKPRTAKKAKAG